MNLYNMEKSSKISKLVNNETQSTLNKVENLNKI